MPMQNKILNADALEIRGWPHQEACVICNRPLRWVPTYACFVPLPKLFQTKFSVGQILNTIRFAHLNDYTAIGTWWEEAVKKFTETIVKI